jgi:hypothetical protein
MKTLPAPVPGGVAGEVELQKLPRGRGSEHFPILDISRLIMCQIAALLPPGQRGDFEDVEDKLREVRSRLDYKSSTR